MGAAGAISGSAVVQQMAGGEDVAEFVREMKASNKGNRQWSNQAIGLPVCTAIA